MLSVPRYGIHHSAYLTAAAQTRLPPERAYTKGRHMGTSRKGNNQGKRPKIPRRAFCRVSHLLFTTGLLSFDHLILVHSATCCINSTSGLAFDSSCVCLVDNAQVTGQNLTRGESALYHWVLESSSAELITLVPRGNLTFRLSPCNGSARMDIKTASPASWPYMPSFSSRDNWNPATLTTSVQASEYAVFVTAGNDSDTTVYDIATYNTLLDTPVPGGGGLLTATMPTSSTAAVSISTSEVGSGNSSYRLYWSSLYTGTADSGAGSHGCTTPTDGVSLMNNSNCLFSSVCGMERAAEGWSDWETLSNGISHSFEAPVTSGVEYIFNVAIRDSNNITFAYRASNMSFFLTTYQQCVSDPDCQSQLHDDTTIITVCAVVVATLAILLSSTNALRSSIRNTMEKATVTTARGPIFAGRSFRSSRRQASAKAGDKYKSPPLPGTPKLTPKAQQGRRIHMDFEADTNGNNNGAFGNGESTETAANNEEGHWEDATEEPRNLKASTRLMKSPPIGRQSLGSHNSNDDDSDNSPRGHQVTSRRDRRKKSPAPLSDDEESDSNEKPREKEESGGGLGSGANGSEDQGPPPPRRIRRPDNRARNMMTKTKQDIRGGTLGGMGGGHRSRRPNPSRRQVNNNSDEEEPNGEEKTPASSQFSPSRSRRNPASPGGATVGRGNRGL